MTLGLAAFIPFLHILRVRTVASRPDSLVCVPVDTIAFCLPNWQEPQHRLVPKNLNPVSFPAQVKRIHLRIANMKRQMTKSLSLSGWVFEVVVKAEEGRAINESLGSTWSFLVGSLFSTCSIVLMFLSSSM